MLKPSSKVAGLVVRLFIASLFLALPAITAQESHAVAVVSCANGGPCAVGDTGPGGGIVYYIAASGTSFTESGATCNANCNMLEWAPNTWSRSTRDPLIAWDEVGLDQIITLNHSNSATDYSGSGALGAGKSNTGRMQGVNSWTEGTIPGYGGTDSSRGEWFIPSQKELQLILTSGLDLSSFCRGSAGSHPLGCPASSFYWSSTDISTTDAVGADFSTSTLAAATKTTAKYVRLIRAFSATIKASDSAPTIASATISGTVKVGQVLTATGDSVTGTPTPTTSYEWKAGGSVVGSNGETYTIASGDFGKTITVKITVANTVSPSASATSNPTAAVALADTSPGITSATISGIVKVGEVLTATANGVTGSPSPTAAYQWKAGGFVVGTNSSTYTIASGDLGKTITVKITESNGVGSNAAATSNPTTAVSSSTTSIGSGGDALILLAANSQTNLNAVKLTGSGQALQIAGFTGTSTIKVVVSTSFGKVGISATTGLSTVNDYPQNLSESATAIAFSGSKANLNAALNSFKFFAPTGAGTAYLLFTVTSDGYEPPLTRSLNIGVRKNQAVLTITNTDLIASIGDTVTVRGVGGALDGGGPISYSVVGGGVGCVIDENTGVLTTDIDTNCSVVATRPGDGTYLSVTSASKEFEFNPRNQPTPIVIGYNKLVITTLEETITLTASGGNGDGALTFATKSENCYIAGNIIHAIQSGRCDVIATRAPSGKYAIATSQWPTTFFVNITQTVSDSITVVVPTTLEAGDTLTLTTKLGLILNNYESSIEYKVSGTGCGAYDPETHQLFSARAVTCSVIAYWSSTAPFKYQQSPVVTIIFNLKTPTALSFPETYTGVVGIPLEITAFGGNPDTSTVSYRVTGTGCSNATPSNYGRSITLSVNAVAYCSVIASQQSDGKYGFVSSASQTVTFGKAASTKVLSVGTPLNAPKAGDRIYLSATATTPGGSDTTTVTADVDFTVSGKNCTKRDSDKTLYASGLAYCTVTASWAATSSYTYAQSSAKTIVFLTQSAPGLSLPDTVTAKAGRPFTLVATGGNPETSTVSYIVSGSNCGSPVTSGKSVTFTPTSATRCTVTVSQGPTDTYNFVSFTKSYSFDFDTAPALLVKPETTTAYVGVALAISVEGGNTDTSTVTFKVTGDAACGSGTLSLDKRTLTLQPSVTAYCTISASQPAAGRYGYVTSSSSTIAFKLGQSPALIIDETVTATAGEEFRFKARGGNGSAITYTVSGIGCQGNETDNYLIIRTTAVVYCTIQAKQDATTTLTYAQSASRTIKFAARDYSETLTVTNASTYDVGTQLTLTNSAPAFGDQILYVASPANVGTFTTPSGACNVVDKKIANSVEAYCFVYAYWPSGSVYNYKKSESKLIHFVLSTQAEFSISNTFTSVVKTDSFTVTTRGGSGTGAVTYAKKKSATGVDLDPLCTLTPNGNGTATLRASAATTCSITATKAAQGKYARSTSQTVTFTFRKS